MLIGHLTEQHLDAIAVKPSAMWSEDYRRRFAELVQDVRKFNPPMPKGYERPTEEPNS